MKEHIVFSNLVTSWTKYDIVQVLDVIYSIDTINSYLNKKASIDEPILRSFLGMKTLQDPIPSYWFEIQKYPVEKKIFSFLALMFTHGEIVNLFANKYSTGNMRGLFKLDEGKQFTNIRSALIQSGASDPSYRRKDEVPYDFSVIFYNPSVGKLFKEVLLERFSRLTDEKLSDNRFYDECIFNEFPRALSIRNEQFKMWLEGLPFDAHYIRKISINNFFSAKEIDLDFDQSNEIYFLGENGDGKSLLLMALYLAFNGNFVLTKTEKENTGKAVDILEKKSGMELSGLDEKGQSYNPNQANYIKNIYAYGTHRGRYSANNTERYGFMSLFDSDETLIDPVAWLKDQKLLEQDKGKDEKKDGDNGSFHLVVSEIENMLYELLEKNINVTIQGTDIRFIENGFSLSLDQLSEGYRSVIIFVCDLLYRLTTNNKEDIKSIKGVVLIDEIDSHLHPRWQRVIVKRLRKFFPNIQFFLTTHSPTIIQGASDDGKHPVNHVLTFSKL